MAKLLKMLNVQNLIILIVLLATTLVNSTRQAGTPSGSSNEITENDIQIFVNCLEHYNRSRTEDTEDDINHFNSWQYWNSTSRAFKANCVVEHWDQVNGNSGRDDSGQLAYRALDKLIRAAVTYDQELLTNNATLREGLLSTLSNGQYLRFAAYWEDHKNDVERGIRRLRRNDRHMTTETARLMVMLEGYLARFP